MSSPLHIVSIYKGKPISRLSQINMLYSDTDPTAYARDRRWQYTQKCKQAAHDVGQYLKFERY